MIDIDRILEEKINRVEIPDININVKEIINIAENKKNKKQKMKLVSIIICLVFFIINIGIRYIFNINILI